MRRACPSLCPCLDTQLGERGVKESEQVGWVEGRFFSLHTFIYIHTRTLTLSPPSSKNKGRGDKGEGVKRGIPVTLRAQTLEEWQRQAGEEGVDGHSGVTARSAPFHRAGHSPPYWSDIGEPPAFHSR
mmetsp:Transcript_43271/g.112430  ORF Transcript_43271/g.112430 Transcript_43271/m.112430 type:complete len:128 (-) Transcript_43271:560-943(-)